MAVTSVILDIKANTDRALNDFKRFSAQLDNKFLVSGLKLDVVRNALGQINREFQRAIGEQGLQAGQSLRAAQNQAAMLLDTFKSVGPEAAESITQQFSSAFSEIAVKAGGTAKDIQKALSATPFISTNLSEDMRSALAQGVMDFQRDFRRAGLGDEYGAVIREFLAGQITAGELSNSADPLRSRLGLEFQRLGGTPDLLGSAEARSRVVSQFQQSRELRETLNRMMDRANYGQFIIEDLNTRLFNPERGVFGVLRQVTMSVTDKTTIFRETRSLIDSVFGQQGLFVNFFKQIAKIFGIEDPLRLIITGIRFITRQFNALNEFVQSPEFQSIVTFVRDIFTRTKDFFTEIYNQVTSGTFDKESVIEQIKSIGETVRGYIKKIADIIRGENVSDKADFGTSIIGTLVEEIGKTLVTLISEIGGALIPKAGVIAAGLVGALVPALAGVMGAVFSNPLTGTLGAAFLGYQAVRGARAIGGVRDSIDAIRGGQGGLRGAANRALGRPFRSGSLEDRGLASSLGSEQTFHRQVIFYLSRITACVCGPGGPGASAPRGGPSRDPITGRTYDQYVSDIPDFGSDQPSRDTRRGRRGLRLPRFRGLGRAALLGTAAAGLIALSGGAAMAATDPMTGEPIESPRMGAGAAFGSVGMGAAQGALTGAMFGPWGAAIGGVIGGGIALLDKGVRDAIGKFISSSVSSFMRMGGELVDGLKRNIFGAFESIKNFAAGIDLKTVLINALIPGGQFTIQGLQSLGDFASKLNIFDSIKTGIDAIANPVKSLWDKISGWDWPWNKREAGGPVIKGTSYIVGERGPEIFTPGQNGVILPNRDLMAASSRSSVGGNVSANFNVSINVNGGMGVNDVEALRAPVISIIEEAWAAVTQGTVSRGAIV